MSSPPMGWYPDPSQPTGGWRWWDGTQWGVVAAPTAYAGYAAGAGVDVDGEERAAKWAKRGLVTLAAAQFGVALANTAMLRALPDFFDEIDAASKAANTNSTAPTPHLPPLVVVSQPLGLLSLAGLVLFVIWLHKASVNATRLGYRLPRSPGWAVAGLFIPVVNLWWPYQSVKALLPAGDPSRRHVGWWFGAFMLSGLFGTGMAVTLAFAPLGVGLAATALTIGVAAAMVWHGHRMIDSATRAHRS